MAKKETENKPKNVVEATPEEMDKVETNLDESKEVSEDSENTEEKNDENKKTEDSKEDSQKDEKQYRRLTRKEREEKERERALQEWSPKTKIGKMVLAGDITDLDDVLENRKKVLEPEIIDKLVKLETDLILIGQAKGKFGGGKRRAWRQTQKKTKEGNVLSFSCMAVVGDKKGHVGVGYGKAKETLPSREKAIRNAKLNLIKVKRGFETPEPEGNKPHTIPFIVEGKCGSVRIKLMPAPRGTGLVVGDECKKILRLAGIEDVYSFTKGQTKISFNLARACIDALQKTTKEII